MKRTFSCSLILVAAFGCVAFGAATNGGWSDALIAFVFALSMGTKKASLLTVGAIAAALVKAAVWDAVKNTEVIK